MRSYFMVVVLSLGSLLPAGSYGETPLVPTAVVETRTLLQEQVLDGIVEAVNRSTVSAQTAGRVKEILVDVNDFVEKGAPIVRLRDTEQRAGLEQVQATLKEAQARSIRKPRPSTTGSRICTTRSWSPRRSWIQSPLLRMPPRPGSTPPRPG